MGNTVMDNMIYYSKYVVNGVTVRNFGESHVISSLANKCLHVPNKTFTNFMEFLEKKLQENMNNEGILDIYAEVQHLNFSKDKAIKTDVSNLGKIEEKYFACFSGDKRNLEALKNRCEVTFKPNGEPNSRFHTFDFRSMSDEKESYLEKYLDIIRNDSYRNIFHGELNFGKISDENIKSYIEITYFRILLISLFACLTEYLILGEKIEINDKFDDGVNYYYDIIKDNHIFETNHILRFDKKSQIIESNLNYFSNNNLNKKPFYVNFITNIVNDMEINKITKNGFSKSSLKIRKIGKLNPKLANETKKIFSNKFRDFLLEKKYLKHGPTLPQISSEMIIFLSKYAVDIYAISRLLYNIIREDVPKSSSVIIISGAIHARFYDNFFEKIKSVSVEKIYEADSRNNPILPNCLPFEE